MEKGDGVASNNASQYSFTFYKSLSISSVRFSSTTEPSQLLTLIQVPDLPLLN